MYLIPTRLVCILFCTAIRTSLINLIQLLVTVLLCCSWSKLDYIDPIHNLPHSDMIILSWILLLINDASCSLINFRSSLHVHVSSGGTWRTVCVWANMLVCLCDNDVCTWEWWYKGNIMQAATMGIHWIWWLSVTDILVEVATRVLIITQHHAHIVHTNWH